ncbi:MAG: glycosyltransferase family 4 protein [candidate division KSB1 bacterium]|nr:glycosyltransferase family 4 protein [candidate division KSB1 bacterium]
MGTRWLNTIVDNGVQWFGGGSTQRMPLTADGGKARPLGSEQKTQTVFEKQNIKNAGRTLIIVQNLPVPFDRRVWLEACTLNKSGCQVSVICPKSEQYSKSFEQIQDIAVYRYHMPVEARGIFGYLFEFVYAWLATALLSLRVLKNEGFDVIQACNPPDTFFLLAAIYKLFGKKFIFDHHDLSPEMFAAKFTARHPMLFKGLCILERLTLKTADVVISTNESYKKVAVSRGRRKPEDVYVLRTGPDLSKLQLHAPNPFFRHGKRYLVTYLGEMCSQDGVDYMLHAVDYIVHHLKRNDIQFVLMGGGPAMPEYREMSQKMGLSDWVRFTGRVSDPVLSQYLSTSDICIAPDPMNSWTNSSTMNKVLEYMSFAKPVISFDLKETRVSAGESALYIPANDTDAMGRAVIDLLADPISRTRMGYHGYLRVHQKLSWTHTHHNLLRAYMRFFPVSLTEPSQDSPESIPMPRTLSLSFLTAGMTKVAGGE